MKCSFCASHESHAYRRQHVGKADNDRNKLRQAEERKTTHEMDMDEIRDTNKADEAQVERTYKRQDWLQTAHHGRTT